MSATRFCGVGTTSLRLESSDESIRSTIQRGDGVYSNMYVRLTANAAATDLTVRFRKNSANGNQSVTIGAGATGAFEDTTGVDSAVAGDLISTSWSLATPAAQTVTPSLMSFIFNSENPTQLIVMQVAAWDYTLTSNNVSRFTGPMGDIAASGTESTKRARYRVGAIIRRLTARVSVNNRTTDTTVRSRKNGANGAMSFIIGASVTGTFTDSVNEDVIAAGDEFNHVYEMGASSESLVSNYVGTTYVSEEDAYPIFAGFDLGEAQTFNTTFFYPVGGSLNASRSATEGEVKVKARSIFRAFGMFVRVSANTIATSPTTVTLRKNGADTGLSVSIGAGATGIFEDTTNYIPVANNDELNYSAVTPNTSGSLTFTQIGIMAEIITAQMNDGAVPLQMASMSKAGSGQAMGLQM